jgi:cytochrome P450
MPVPVHELDLPTLELLDVERAEALRRLAEAAEGHWLARNPFGVTVLRYRDAVAVLRDRRFHSAVSLIPQMAGIPDAEITGRTQPSILAMEGPEHDRLRRLVAPAFSARAADRLRPFMREVLDGLLEPVLPRGRCDLVTEVCEPYPIPVICELLGAPTEDWKLFSGWATDIFRVFNNNLAADLPVIRAAFAELEAYVLELIERRRRAPGDDLLSALIAAEEAGDRLSTDELVMMTEAVLMAGTDTTRNQLACSVALLAAHPDQWALLVEQPELAPRAVEETMRVLGAVAGTVRVAAEDVEYRDVRFPAGTLVVVSLAGANRDPEIWSEPGRFDITREPSTNPQLTFGAGVHFCLGANLARAELAEALALLARRLGPIEPDGPIAWKPPTVGIWGPTSLPLRFTPPG